MNMTKTFKKVGVLAIVLLMIAALVGCPARCVVTDSPAFAMSAEKSVEKTESAGRTFTRVSRDLCEISAILMFCNVLLITITFLIFVDQ